MAGYFTLFLDTTAPHISIYAPPYSNNSTANEIRVVADENVGEFQNIYIVDSMGFRHDVIFSKVSENEYSGQITFNEYPIGIATIYAQLKDEVGNISELVSKAINIITTIDSFLMELTLSEISRELSIYESTMSTDATEEKMPISIEEYRYLSMKINDSYKGVS